MKYSTETPTGYLCEQFLFVIPYNNLFKLFCVEDYDMFACSVFMNATMFIAGVFKFEREFYCVIESTTPLTVNVVREGPGTEAPTISK